MCRSLLSGLLCRRVIIPGFMMLNVWTCTLLPAWMCVLFCLIASWALGRKRWFPFYCCPCSVICLTNGTTKANYDYYVLLHAKHYVRFSVYFSPLV